MNEVKRAELRLECLKLAIIQNPLINKEEIIDISNEYYNYLIRYYPIKK
jgi:hypothetical protein